MLVSLTTGYLFLPHPVLVIDKSMPLNAIAKPDQFVAHFFNGRLRHQVLGPGQLLARLHHLPLFLTQS